jgi:hypothetical protein
MAFEPKLISIIRHRGEPQKATTLNGVEVKRERQLFVLADSYNKFFVAAQYDDHFLYDNPTPQQPSFMCTCGAPAVLIPPNTSESQFYCMHHYQYGVHATGGTTWQ